MLSFKKAFKASREAAVAASAVNTATTTLSASSSSSGSSGGMSAGRGVKSWLYGQCLVSTGHRQLDELLGGGCIVGTTLLLEGDLYSNYADTFLAYNLTEALSNQQSAILVVESLRDAQGYLDAMPYNLTLADELLEIEEEVVLIDANSRDNSANNTESLSIAWQYEKYTKLAKEKQRQASKDSFCCSYDLSRKVQPSLLSSPFLHKITRDLFAEGLQNILNSYYIRISKLVQEIKAVNPEEIVRIYLPQLLQIYNVCDLHDLESCKLVARLLLRLKCLARETRSLLFLSYSPDLFPPQLVSYVKALTDTHVSIDSFAGVSDSVPYEFKAFCALLTLKRIQAVGALAPFRPPAHKHGLRRDRRKLHIEGLHLPPEESRAFAGTQQQPQPQQHQQPATATESIALGTSDGSRARRPALELGAGCATTSSTPTRSLDF